MKYSCKTKNVFEKIEILKFNLNEFIKEYGFSKDSYDYEYLAKFKNLEMIWIKDIFIKDEFKGRGYGTKYIKELMNTGKPIILYSSFEAEEYWESIGFKYCDVEYVYFYNLQ